MRFLALLLISVSLTAQVFGSTNSAVKKAGFRTYQYSSWNTHVLTMCLTVSGVSP